MVEELPDPLNEIFVEKNEPADRKLLAEILKPFATIDSTGIISYTKEFDRVKESKKILIYLLCKKAIILKGIQGILEEANLAEVMEKVMVSESNSKNALFTVSIACSKFDFDKYAKVL